MNPFEMIKMINNPKEFVKDYMRKNKNPILENLVKEAENGNNKAIENFANNILKEKGLNLDDIMKKF